MYFLKTNASYCEAISMKKQNKQREYDYQYEVCLDRVGVDELM